MFLLRFALFPVPLVALLGFSMLPPLVALPLLVLHFLQLPHHLLDIFHLPMPPLTMDCILLHHLRPHPPLTLTIRDVELQISHLWLVMLVVNPFVPGRNFLMLLGNANLGNTHVILHQWSCLLPPPRLNTFHLQVPLVAPLLVLHLALYLLDTFHLPV